MPRKLHQRTDTAHATVNNRHVLCESFPNPNPTPLNAFSASVSTLRYFHFNVYFDVPTTPHAFLDAIYAHGGGELIVRYSFSSVRWPWRTRLPSGMQPARSCTTFAVKAVQDLRPIPIQSYCRCQTYTDKLTHAALRMQPKTRNPLNGNKKAPARNNRDQAEAVNSKFIICLLLFVSGASGTPPGMALAHSRWRKMLS